MARITVEDCLEKVDNQYDLVLLAKERTSQLNSGADMLVEQDNDKNTVIALREIGCTPSDMLYIGDSPDRDYAPANGLGIPCLLLRENDNFQGTENRIKSLNELKELFYPQKPA